MCRGDVGVNMWVGRNEYVVWVEKGVLGKVEGSGVVGSGVVGVVV